MDKCVVLRQLQLATILKFLSNLEGENKAIYPVWKDAMLHGFQNVSIFYVNIAAACACN